MSSTAGLFLAVVDGLASTGTNGLRWLDWIVIALYFVSMLGIGWYFSRRQKSTEEYFVGGRSMRSFSIGISLFATLLSTISYLAQPGEMIKHGPIVICGLLYIPVAYWVVGHLFIPHFMRLKVTSAYELLEIRLSLSVRLLGSAIFIATRLVWMALLIYLTAKAMVVVLAMDERWVPIIIVVSGLVTVAYTSAGGFRGVVISDVVQFFILMGGALLTIVAISVQLGGVKAWVPTHWLPTWDHQPLFSFDLTVRATVIGSVVNTIAWWLCTAVSDQMAIQRYAATKDIRHAKRAFLINCMADATVWFILVAVGFALLGFFTAHPEYRPAGKSLIADADYLFPYYISNFVPMGIGGMVVAGMFAAAMSSLASGINSTVTVLQTDFIDRFRRQRQAGEPPPRGVALARILSASMGTAVVLVSALMGKVPGNIMEVTTKTNGLFVGPLAGLFLMALFVPFATALGAICGAICGLAAAIVFAYWDVLTGRPGLSFQYIIPVSVLVHLGVGLLLSLLQTGERRRIVPAPAAAQTAREMVP